MKKETVFDAILLLGLELDENDCPKPELILRIDAAERAYREGMAEKIVVCGGRLPGRSRAEADVMAEELELRGVPTDGIWRENCSQTTMENMRFAAEMLGGARGKRVLVVTSDYHLLRSVMTARRAGFKARGRAAALAHDEAWKRMKREEWAYTVDLLMGWQDEGKHRPAWTVALFDTIFGRNRPRHDDTP